MAGLLVVGFSWSSTPVGVPEPTIQATVAEDPDKRKAEEARRRREEEERKQAEAERQRQAAEEARKREVETKRKEEERRAEEKRKQAEAEKQRQAELKRKEEERKKAEAEAERKRQEADAKKKREEAEARRKAAEESLREQLEAEEHARAEAARAARAQSELQKYVGAIQRKVRDNWTAVGTGPGLQCVVRVRLAPGGEVLQATVVRGSGNPVFDRSVPPAVYKASPLPIPSDPTLFDYFREIDFIFKPE